MYQIKVSLRGAKPPIWRRLLVPGDITLHRLHEAIRGIWGYQELIEVLADPEHEEHEERLEWLGLDDASQFSPDSFDVDEVNRRLRSV